MMAPGRNGRGAIGYARRRPGVDKTSRGWRRCSPTPGGRARMSHGFVNPPLHRGSTVLYEDMAQRRAFMKQAASTKR